MTADVVSIDDFRPHDTGYVVCMSCAHDWVGAFPVGVNRFECPKCGEMHGEIVNYKDKNWFARFMSGRSGADAAKRTLVLLNAAQAWRD